MERLADEAELLVRRREARARGARVWSRRPAAAEGRARRRRRAPRRASARARARVELESPGATTRSARNARRDAVLERVPDDRDAGQLPVRYGAEAPVVARRVEVAPVEVLGVADEVVPVAGARARPSASKSGRSARRAAPRGRRRRRRRRPGAQPAVLARPAEQVAGDGADAQRPRPQPKPRQVDPAEPGRRRSDATAPFGNVTVSGEPASAAARSFSCSSVENTPWPR